MCLSGRCATGINQWRALSVRLTLNCRYRIVIVSVASSRYFTTGESGYYGAVRSFSGWRDAWPVDVLSGHSANSSINHLFLTANWFSAVNRRHADSARPRPSISSANASLTLRLADSEESVIRFLNSIRYQYDVASKRYAEMRVDVL